MDRAVDVILFRGKLLKSGRYEVRIYVYAEYKDRLEKYVGSEVEGILIIRGREK